MLWGFYESTNLEYELVSPEKPIFTLYLIDKHG